jgi:hypothetical protein
MTILRVLLAAAWLLTGSYALGAADGGIAEQAEKAKPPKPPKRPRHQAPEALAIAGLGAGAAVIALVRWRQGRKKSR